MIFENTLHGQHECTPFSLQTRRICSSAHAELSRWLIKNRQIALEKAYGGIVKRKNW